jgi:hypothetical protein
MALIPDVEQCRLNLHLSDQTHVEDGKIKTTVSQ